MAKKILIIDDEQDLSEMLKFRLESNGYEVFTAWDGPSGVEEAKTKLPDLIILDMMLPVWDGFEVAKRLKMDSSTSLIPIIVFTAAINPELNKKIFEIGASGCVTKPFDPEYLLEKVKNILL